MVPMVRLGYHNITLDSQDFQEEFGAYRYVPTRIEV